LDHRGCRILPGDLNRLAGDKIRMASVGEISGILEAIVKPRAALDAVIAGELVPGEEVRVVEDETLRIFVGLDL